jgi:hypothetical protein
MQQSRERAPVSAAHWRSLHCNDGCDTRLAAQPMLHVSLRGIDPPAHEMARSNGEAP